MLPSTSIWACLVVLVVAVASDIFTRKIPNTVTLGGVVVGLAIHLAIGIVDSGLWGAARGLGFALGGAFACGIIPFIAWRRGELGGGDVKLFAAIGALMGPGLGFNVQAITFTISLVILFPYRLVRYGALKPALSNFGIGLANVIRKRQARVAYVTGPKLPPVILAPTIGIAFVLSMISNGALR
jgi:prepilin peptidase CpaA